MGNFAGTADYYDRFRPGVTGEVVQTVLAHVPQPVHLLDLGTGTSRILEQFVPYFEDIVAVEPDHDMLKLARKRLLGKPVRFVHAAAEDAQLPDGWQASLVIICRAFHWMDRPRVLKKLEDDVLPHGVLALMSDHSFWHLPTDEWSEIIRSTIKEFLGPERRTALGTYRPPDEYFRDNLLGSAFNVVHETVVPVERQWDVDSIVGYLYSTSFASHAVLGDKAAAFEKTLRARLLEYAPDNVFVEHNRFEIVLASRPA